MWDSLSIHPMRKDYRGNPDDYEWEPTPHDDVLERAKQHYTPRPQLDRRGKYCRRRRLVKPLKR